MSVSSGGEEARGRESSQSNWPAISADGRHTAFESWAENLVLRDTNFIDDVFVRDLYAARTVRVSVTSLGQQADGGSFSPSLSADGRFVAFSSEATNLVPGDTNRVDDVFVHDRDADGNAVFDELAGIETTRISMSYDGREASGYSNVPVLSVDGRLVAFGSSASNLVPGDGNNAHDAFLHDRVTGETERISVSSDGAEANGDSGPWAISADGSLVMFMSLASNLVPNDNNNFCDFDGDGIPHSCTDVFVRDRRTGTTTLVSVSSNGEQANAVSIGESMSADGRYVLISSSASNLTRRDLNPFEDLFLRDMWLGETSLISTSSEGEQLIYNSFSQGAMSGDGRWIAFRFGDNMYLKDRSTGTLRPLLRAYDGGEPEHGGEEPRLSYDGSYLAFSSGGANLVPYDFNFARDIFVHGTMRCPDGGGPHGPVSGPLHSDVEPAASRVGGGGLLHTANCAAIVRAGL